jgi:GNAT superfamily N-acetyltransferase
MTFSDRQHQLKDGRVVIIRRAAPGDLDRLGRYFNEMAADDQRQRFLSGAVPSRLALEKALAGAVVWLLAVTPSGELVGESVRTRLYDDPFSDLQGPLATVELSVAAAWLRVGLAKALIEAVSGEARDGGARYLMGYVARTNRPALCFLNRYWVCQRSSDVTGISVYFRTL